MNEYGALVEQHRQEKLKYWDKSLSQCQRILVSFFPICFFGEGHGPEENAGAAVSPLLRQNHVSAAFSGYKVGRRRCKNRTYIFLG
jgi:hypothetical protein